MTPDAELLRRYADEKSEAAFAELVQRHLGLVYFAARRQLAGDEHRGREVAQLVFTDLARKAAALQRHPALVSWLHTSTRFAATKLRRTEGRRVKYEQAAQAVPELMHAIDAGPDWARLQPWIDELVHELNEREREAVLLRFFEGHAFAEIGRALAVSEDAARMRVERGLEKLRAALAQRGVTSTAAALGLVLQGNAAAATPAGLSATVTGFALGAAGAAGGLVAGGFLLIMNSSVWPSLAAITAAVIAVGAAFYNVRTQRTAERALLTASQQSTAASVRLRELERRVADETAAVAALERATPAPRPVAPPAAASRPAVDEAPEYRAGAELLATNPAAQAAAARILRGFFDQDYIWAMQAIGLAPGEAERIAQDAAGWSQLTVDGGIPGFKFSIGTDGGPDGLTKRLRELLGEERYGQMQEARLALQAKGAVRALAGATFDTDIPLTPAQTAALSEIVDRNRAVGARDAAQTTIAIDWPAITRQAAEVLSPAQLAVFQSAVVTRGQATQTLRNLP